MKIDKEDQKLRKKRLDKSKVRTQIIELEELEKLSVEKQEYYFEVVFD